MEHRWGQRSNLRVPVQLLIGDSTPASGSLQNLSVSGAFVRTRWPAPLGTLLELEFPLINTYGQGQLRTAAYVTRRAADGIGIEWYDLAPPVALALLGRQSAGTESVTSTDQRPYAPRLNAGSASQKSRALRDRSSLVGAA